MENLAFRIEKERRIGPCITIGAYNESRRVIGPRSIWAASVSSGDFISAKTTKQKGKVIIPLNNLTPGELAVLYHTGDYWAVYFHRIEELIVYATAWAISKRKAVQLQFKKEVIA